MSEMAMPENSDLLEGALDAAGGLERWRQRSFLSAHLSQGGGLWAMKGIMVAIADDLLIAHPDRQLAAAGVVMMVAGPALYLLGESLVRLRMIGSLNPQ